MTSGIQTRGCRAAAFACLLLIGCGPDPRESEFPESDFARIPAGTTRVGSGESRETHPPRIARNAEFLLGRTPVTARQFADYLNAAGISPPPVFPDLVFRKGRWRARLFSGSRPARGVTRDEAEAYGVWFSHRYGVRAGLPTADEWEIAARGGIVGARYPWGWGDPRGRARFAASGPARVGRYRANPFGLLDMAGNVFQWTSDEPEPEIAIACGGAWSELNSRRLRVFERTRFPVTYRGADVGFRVRIQPVPENP